MHDDVPKLRISGRKAALNLFALVLMGAGLTQCVGGRWPLGILAAYAGFLIVFFCGAHGLAARARGRNR